MTNPVGFGIFMWDAIERRSNRYGSFFMADAPYDGSLTVTPRLDDLMALVGKRVRVACKVVESRVSVHIGDLFLDITPTRPNVGEVIELGVAELGLGTADDGKTSILMYPEDRSRDLWIDPRKFYRLHDQTVELYIEPTDAPLSPRVMCFDGASDGIKADGEGGIQTKNVDPATVKRIAPRLTRLGEGLFTIDHVFSRGDDVTPI